MSDDVQHVPRGPSWLGHGLLREAARVPDSFGLLLALTLADFFLLSVLWQGNLATVVRTTVWCLTALFGIHTSHVRRPLFTWAVVAVVAAIIATIVKTQQGGPIASGISDIAIALLALATPIAVLSRIIQHRTVTAQTLLGVICVYLMLGLLFAYADLSIQAISGQFFAQAGAHPEPDFVYFSFTTMTTVGYGDLTATTGFPRNMAVLEALVGQIFLVVLVARLVSLYAPGSVGARRRALHEARLARSTGAGESADGMDSEDDMESEDDEGGTGDPNEDDGTSAGPSS
jgi:hypothetical protein